MVLCVFPLGYDSILKNLFYIYDFFLCYLLNVCIFKDLNKKLMRIKMVLSEITGALITQFLKFVGRSTLTKLTDHKLVFPLQMLIK